MPHGGVARGTWGVAQIKEGALKMEQKNLDKRTRQLHGRAPDDALPGMTWAAVQRGAAAGRALVVIDGLVHDVSSFISDHPGEGGSSAALLPNPCRTQLPMRVSWQAGARTSRA